MPPDDAEVLHGWLRTESLPQSIGQRARILLLLASGLSPREVGEQLQVSAPVVFKWRKRYQEDGLEGLHDRPRSGAPRKLDEAKIKEILTLTTQRVPREATHWSLRLMARYAGVTIWQVAQVWEAADLKPNRLKTIRISNDPHFADKVVDIVGLYLSPPDNALVLSVDEKAQIQTLDRTQPMRPLKPGPLERRTHDYKHQGTASLYAAFDILTGKVGSRIAQRHRAKEFLEFLRQVDCSTPAELDLHVILDNGSTHATVAVREWLEKHPRFKLHLAPTSASWLNAVEGWLAQLERRAVSSVADLRAAVRRFIEAHDQHSAKPLQWNRTADAASKAGVSRTDGLD